MSIAFSEVGDGSLTLHLKRLEARNPDPSIILTTRNDPQTLGSVSGGFPPARNELSPEL